MYTFPSLGKTLRAIAVNGAKEFYEGETAVNLVRDIQVGTVKYTDIIKYTLPCRLQAAGGIITMEDMRNYRVRWEKPVEHTLKNLGYKVTIYNIYNIHTTPQVISSPPPGSGAILASILGVMDAYQPGSRDLHRPLIWHRSVHI